MQNELLGTYHAPRRKESEVDHSITLFTESIQLGYFFDSKPLCDRVADMDSDDLPDKRPNNDPVQDKYEVQVALLITGIVGGRRGNTVGYEEYRCKWIEDSLCNKWRE